jgi:hypothetical protein
VIPWLPFGGFLAIVLKISSSNNIYNKFVNIGIMNIDKAIKINLGLVEIYSLKSSQYIVVR